MLCYRFVRVRTYKEGKYAQENRKHNERHVLRPDSLCKLFLHRQTRPQLDQTSLAKLYN
jgi:hypothetical protein